MTVKLKKGKNSNYTYKGKLFDYTIHRLDDGKSFGWSEHDKKTGKVLYTDGWYGLTIKGIRDIIISSESD